MSTDDEKDRIEELRKSLYSKSHPPPTEVKRRKLHDHPYQTTEDWEKIPEKESAKEPVYRGQYSGLFRGLLIFALIFFLASVAIAAIVYYRGGNVVSPNNIGLTITAPVSVAAGQVLTIDVDVTNKNNTPLELADLTFDYPDGTKSAADFNTPLKSDQLSINTIAPGQTIRETDKSVLYGEENSHQDVKVTLTYRIPGSNAVYTKENDYSILIASAPVTLTINSLNEINSGQDLTLNAHIVSNASIDLNNLMLTAEYPFGFTFESATPTPTFQNNVWNLGTLNTNDTRDITITGQISGEDGDQRVFHFDTGTASSSELNSISTVFVNTSQTVAISKPFFETALSFDGDPSNVHTIASGVLVHGQINWQNNLTTAITNASITLNLAGVILDKTSVDAGGGFYQSADGNLTWDQTNTPELANIPPGASDSVHFTFQTMDPTFQTMSSFRNPTITFNENVTGQRLSDTNVPESITSGASSTIKVASNLLLSSTAVHTIGPFTNSGPIPPVAEQSTTYTINWALTNSYNRADNVVVTATLPSYVTWLGEVSPNTEQVAYNPVNRQITWQVGNLDPGTGFLNSPRALAFQVSLLPSVSQVGDSPTLVNGATVNATDDFTNTPLTNSNSAVTTRISTDPTFHAGDDQVVAP